MDTLISSLVKWFKTHNITSHVVAGFVTAVAIAYASDDQVRNLFIGLFSSHPKVLATIGTIFALWLKYSSGHSATGILQEAPKAQEEVQQSQQQQPTEPVHQVTNPVPTVVIQQVPQSPVVSTPEYQKEAIESAEEAIKELNEKNNR